MGLFGVVSEKEHHLAVIELKRMIQEICPHKVVKHKMGYLYPIYGCIVCEKLLAEKPKGSKELVVKEELI